ncbi:hypothetical protein ABVN80_05085 [Acinetobacter baumannii]
MDHLRFVLLKRDGATSPFRASATTLSSGVRLSATRYGMRVLDPETIFSQFQMAGETMGEIMFRSNIPVMKRIFKNPRPTVRLLQWLVSPG